MTTVNLSHACSCIRVGRYIYISAFPVLSTGRMSSHFISEVSDLGKSNPLTARTVVKASRVLPILCYDTENWILDDNSLGLLNCFQSELGKRILRLSRFHSHLAPLLALSWPSMTARIHLYIFYLQNMTPLSLEHSTLLPPKVSTASVLCSGVYFS